MSFRTYLLAGAMLAFAAVSGNSFAQPMGGGHHGEGMELLHSLNLTDTQKEQVHQIEKGAWAQAKPLMKQAHAVHEQLAAQMLSTDSVTADQLQPMVQQEQQIRGQLDALHLNTMLQIRALLTPEQLTQAAATHQKMEALHEQERHVMSGGPGGEE